MRSLLTIASTSGRLVAAWAVCTSVLGCADAKTVAEPAPEAARPDPPRPAQPAPAPPAPATPAPAEDLPRTLASFGAAVEQAKVLYAADRKTAFCGCQFSEEGRVAWGTCGYQARADEELAREVAWELLVPVRAFGASRACWKTPQCVDDQGKPFGGIRCCRESDPVFVAMESDLHNIVPVVAELQQDRASYGFGEVDREQRMYGLCNFEVDRERGVVEPREDRRGDIARAYLYMVDVYGDAVSITPEEMTLFRSWHEADPPDEWEIRRNTEIAKLQGRANPFVPLPG